MSNGLSGATRRARKQLRDAYLEGDGAAVLALLGQVVAASRVGGKELGRVWAPAEQFSRLFVCGANPLAANDASYEPVMGMLTHDVKDVG